MAETKIQEVIQPTRRPWAIYDFEGQVKDYPKTIIVAPTRESILEVSGGWPQCTLAENEVNAALIVRAVNNHDALVEALGYVVEVIPPADYRQRDDSDQVQITVTVGWLREVAQALAAAHSDRPGSPSQATHFATGDVSA